MTLAVEKLEVSNAVGQLLDQGFQAEITSTAALVPLQIAPRLIVGNFSNFFVLGDYALAILGFGFQWRVMRAKKVAKWVLLHFTQAFLGCQYVPCYRIINVFPEMSARPANIP